MDVRLARTQAELAAALELRRRVFCGEQGVPREADQDGRDPDALHLVAVADEQLLGTCRLLVRGRAARLGRLAVEPEARRRGVGTALLAAAAREARQAGASEIDLHAQIYARHLYEREGYVERGDEFIEEGIAHVAMRKTLA